MVLCKILVFGLVYILDLSSNLNMVSKFEVRTFLLAQFFPIYNEMEKTELRESSVLELIIMKIRHFHDNLSSLENS